MEKEKYDLSRYADRLYLAAVRKTRDSGAAEDIAQETFLAALVQLSRGKRPENVWAWLLAILSNKYCDWLREKYNRPQISFEEYPFEIAGESVEEDESDDSEEKLEAIRRELGRLAEIHREVIIRYYMHNQAVQRIANELQIPVGTVKSRLNLGRQHIREKVTDMENYTKQSYEPDTLHIACAGGAGLHEEPFSLVPDSDMLAQSILIMAYRKPLAETELAKTLGVPAAFVEPVVEKLIAGELMKRTNGGRAYTDFIIYTDTDRKETFEKQLSITEKYFPLFWEEMNRSLTVLREKQWYQQQTEHARTKLELHFCVKTLKNAVVSVRDEVTGVMSYSEYPYRKDGGRWIAMGMQYPAGYRHKDDVEFWKYEVNGEAGYVERNFRDTKTVELRCYGTSLNDDFSYSTIYDHAQQYVKWFYELWQKIPAEESAISVPVIQEADNLIKQGFLKNGNTLELDIPVLDHAAYREECELVSEYEGEIAARVREILLPVFGHGGVRLPSHLKSVPKWQQYMFCGNSVPMMVIYKAREKGLFLKDVGYLLPAALLICEKA